MSLTVSLQLLLTLLVHRLFTYLSKSDHTWVHEHCVDISVYNANMSALRANALICYRLITA